jgi:23S rRNA (guanosine2251-2'-O)-methyltransferase
MKTPHTHRPGGSGTGRPPERGPRRPAGADEPRRPDRPATDAGARTLRAPRAAATVDLGEPRRDGAKPHSARSGERPRPDRAPAGAERPTRQGPEAPRGAVWLYGPHAIAAALANPARRLRRLLLTEDAEAAIAAILAKPWPLPAERTDRARLDQLLGRETVHQGAALLADPLAPPALAAVLERPGAVLVLDQVTDPRNVGAILRSAAAFGAAAVIAQERNAPEESGALAKAASGALERVPLLRAVNIARTLIALKAAGCWVVGLDAGGGVLSGPALAERRVALVLGNEGDGLRRLTRDTCDEIAGIAMPGGDRRLDSLNVSAAASIALYELGRHA